MTSTTIAGKALVTARVMLLLALAGCSPAPAQSVAPAAAGTTGTGDADLAPPAAAFHAEMIYGRITDVDGVTYEGRLRWGGDEEAFWGDHFDGAKRENPWALHVPNQASPIEIFGVQLGRGGGRINLDRPFMARFGDLARVDVHFRTVQVTLKSGMTVALDRFEAGDIDDGVRVWNGGRGIVDLDARRIRTIEFLAHAAPPAAAAGRLHGTVRTHQGDFTGFVEWDGREGLGTDTLDGRTSGRDVSVPYGTIRSIARRSRDSALVTRLDGRVTVLSDTREAGRGHRGIYVDDRRYGRVRISWDAFERVDFSSGGSGPAYQDFEPGRPMTGRVTTRDGRRLAGQLVYDVDESETTETLDVSVQGVDYSFPFGLVRTILPDGRAERGARRPTVILLDGQELSLERNGDLGDGNAGMLVFVGGRERPEYVPWTEIQQIDLDGSPAGEPRRRP